MSTFWRIAPDFSTAADLTGTALSILPVVYPATASQLRGESNPRLNCIRGNENFFDPKECRTVARYLRGAGHEVAVLDWEPEAHGDKTGHTADNRETAEYIVDAFARDNVALHLLYVPLDPDDARWVAAVNGGWLYLAMYPFTPDAKLWREKSMEKIAACRKWHRGGITGWVSPHWSGGSGDGRFPTAPPYGAPVSPDAWKVTMQTVETYCDAGGCWATGYRRETGDVLPWDGTVPWFKALAKRNE